MDQLAHPEIWRPLASMPDGAHEWGFPGYADFASKWSGIRAALKDRETPRRFLEGWLAERGREFAIETGQIEGLYTLRSGITEQLVAEGFAGVVGAHTLEGMEDRTVKGLLEDQEAAFSMLFNDVADSAGLTQHKIKAWHQLLTRHQETVTGLTPAGRRVQVEFKERGQWKRWSNNPRRPDGVIHEYCPPEHVQAEMDRFIDIHAQIEAKQYPVEVEAAWMHHRFVRTHPFRDGSGRVSRMLMAYAYIRRGLPPPVITNRRRDEYISALEDSDRGNLRRFSDLIGGYALPTLVAGVGIGQNALEGHLSRPNGNGGRTVGDQYYPPLESDQNPGMPDEDDRATPGSRVR
ncbi:MAG: Fic family protein [Acidobacteriia bacterium]|nr:Fic family protein [Terriglobia bacterium]MYC66208.1 Fic family protein [Terriglobia bacterium]